MNLKVGMQIKSNKTNRAYIISSIDENSNRLEVSCSEDRNFDSEWLLDMTLQYINSGYYTIMKTQHSDLTDLEIQTLNDIRIDDNGEDIVDTESQYLCLLNTTIPNKTLRGVLASLVKKEYIKVYNDDEARETSIEIQEKAISYYNSL
jgi:hypothetical protein